LLDRSDIARPPRRQALRRDPRHSSTGCVPATSACCLSYRRPRDHLDGLQRPQSDHSSRSNNLVNLLFDAATVGIHLARHRLRAAARRDRSFVGSMSGLASAMVGVLWVNAGLADWRSPSSAHWSSAR
jgi:hypothetical protein